MALQCNVALKGGITHTNAYVRSRTVLVFKGPSGWRGVVEWEVFKDSVEAGKPSEIRKALPVSEIDRDKFIYNLAGTNPVAQAYTWAKANKPQLVGAIDV